MFLLCYAWAFCLLSLFFFEREELGREHRKLGRQEGKEDREGAQSGRKSMIRVYYIKIKDKNKNFYNVYAIKLNLKCSDLC